MNTVSPDERIVNLALALDNAHKPVSAYDIWHDEIIGYGQCKNFSAFLRMFSRDKDRLAQSGIHITGTPQGTYYLNAHKSFAYDLHISDTEIACLEEIGGALLHEETLPFYKDLRYALNKITAHTKLSTVDPSTLNDYLESDLDFDEKTSAPQALTEHLQTPVYEAHAHHVLTRHDIITIEQSTLSIVDSALEQRKRLKFSYHKHNAQPQQRCVEPWGLLSFNGLRYMLAFDIDKQSERIFRLDRMSHLELNTKNPKKPDYNIPAFNISSYQKLPFQYGETLFTAHIHIDSAHAWNAVHITQGLGVLNNDEHNALHWYVDCSDIGELISWCIMHTGYTPIGPVELVHNYQRVLEEVIHIHGA